MLTVPPDLSVDISSRSDRISFNNIPLSSSHPFGAGEPALDAALSDRTSDLSRSLSALSARATSCSRTLECISSFSNCRIRSSSVVM